MSTDGKVGEIEVAPGTGEFILKTQLAETKAALSKAREEIDRAEKKAASHEYRAETFIEKFQAATKELGELKTRIGSESEAIRHAQAQAAEHLLHRRKAERLTDPLRAEISSLQKRLNVQDLLVQDLQSQIRRLERTIIDERRLKEHALETCEAIQRARDAAQRARGEALHDLDEEKALSSALRGKAGILEARIKELEAAASKLQSFAKPQAVRS